MATAEKLSPEIVSGEAEVVHLLIKKSCLGDPSANSGGPIHLAFLHHFKTPGGGTRMRLTERCGAALGVSQPDALRLAASVECLHNASLVQDDLQDESLYRRGQTSVFAEFGRDVALGLTNQLITSAFSLLTRTSRSAVLGKLVRRLAAAVSETVIGQTSELAARAESFPLESRITAARRKSGPLFALALELPLIAAGEDDHLDTAHEAACLFGLGYQFLDDLNDQALDAANGSNGNLVLAMESSGSGEAADHAAARLAWSYLEKAITEAKKLPGHAGRPLIELVERLARKLDAFVS